MTDSTHRPARPNRATAKIRDDINPENTWVVSDTHFGHDNIVGFCFRPEDHEQVMIAEWRKAVSDEATVIHLGDLCYKGNARFKNLVAPELTGKRKILVRFGNHDGQRPSFYRDCGFQMARPFSILYGEHSQCVPCIGSGKRGSPRSIWGDPPVDCWACEGRGYHPYRVSFSHYAWGADDGPLTERDIRLHGHIHNNGYTRDGFVPFLKQHINLSVEQTKYRPVNLKLLLDGALAGVYPESTDEQMAEAARRAARARMEKPS